MITMVADLSYITTIVFMFSNYDYSHLPHKKLGRFRYLLNLEGLIKFEIKTMKLPNIMSLNDYSRNVA